MVGEVVEGGGRRYLRNPGIVKVGQGGYSLKGS